ncbi:STAS domain-containing protein [Spirillospora sp. CA-253888]
MTDSFDADPATVRTAGPRTLVLALSGDLDYDTGGEVLQTARLALREHEGVRELRLDCRGLGMVDSTGLSVLLQIRRDACEDGIGLHLDAIGPQLERLLRLTGTYEYLTAPVPAAPPAEPASETHGSGT